MCDHLAKLVLRREERAERGSEKERNRIEREEERKKMAIRRCGKKAAVSQAVVLNDECDHCDRWSCPSRQQITDQSMI